MSSSPLAHERSAIGTFQFPWPLEVSRPLLRLIHPAVALVLEGTLQLGRQPEQEVADRSARGGLDRQGFITGQLGHPEPGPALRERRGAGEALLEQELPRAGEHATFPPAQPLGLAQCRHHQAELEELAEVQGGGRGAANSHQG